MLPIESRDSRPLHLAIFVTVLLVCYVEVLLFNFEDKLRQLGKRFVIAFPAAVFVVAFLIATSPHIVTHPASWDPRAPYAYETEQWLKRKTEEAASFMIGALPRPDSLGALKRETDPPVPHVYEAEQYLKRKAETETRIDTDAKQGDSTRKVIEKALERAKEGPTFELYPLRVETQIEKAVRLEAERGVSVESMTESVAPDYKEALLEWERTRQFVPPKHSLELKDPIDLHTASYWLALLLLVGAIEFRLLSQKPS